jgi:hypothetical protein
MRYEIDLNEVAIRNLRELPEPVRKYTLAQLDNLSAEPALLSEQKEFIYPFDGQICLFDYDYRHETWHIGILFDYSEDERRLIINAVMSVRTSTP